MARTVELNEDERRLLIRLTHDEWERLDRIRHDRFLNNDLILTELREINELLGKLK